MTTIKGTLTYGLLRDGTRHKDFELRLPTLEDMECALEAVPPGSHLARIQRHLWARCIVSLGALASVSADDLAGLAADEYIHFDTAETALKKKLLTGSEP